MKIKQLTYIFVEDSYNVRFDLPSGHPYSVFLLEDSAFKYTPSYILTQKSSLQEIVFISMVTIEVKTSYFYFFKKEYPFACAPFQFDLIFVIGTN